MSVQLQTNYVYQYFLSKAWGTLCKWGGKIRVIVIEVESCEVLISGHDMADEHISSQQQWLSVQDLNLAAWMGPTYGEGAMSSWQLKDTQSLSLGDVPMDMLFPSKYMGSINWSQGFMNNNKDINLGRTWL